MAAIEKTRELLLTRKNAVATGHRADALLLKRSSKFQELRLVAGMVCVSTFLLYRRPKHP